MTPEQLKKANCINQKINEIQGMISNVEYVLKIREEQNNSAASIINCFSVKYVLRRIWHGIINLLMPPSGIITIDKKAKSQDVCDAIRNIEESELLERLDQMDIEFGYAFIDFLINQKSKYVKMLEEI